MDKQTYAKYQVLVRDNSVYQKMLHIKNINNMKHLVNKSYYKICETVFLKETRMSFSVMSLHKLEYTIKIFFNWFSLTFNIFIIKTTREGNLVKYERDIATFPQIKYCDFTENFIILNIVHLFQQDEANYLEMLPILLKCRSKMKDEIVKLENLIYSFSHSQKTMLPKEIYQVILEFLIKDVC